MKSESVGLGQLVRKLQLPLWKTPWKKNRKEGRELGRYQSGYSHCGCSVSVEGSSDVPDVRQDNIEKYRS